MALSLPTTNIPSLQSQIIATDISQSYPVTIWRKLFSSDPRREFAIRDITLRLGISTQQQQHYKKKVGLTLLVGASSSGKSTLLKILSGAEKPIKGRVEINEIDVYAANDKLGESRINKNHAKPVILSRKLEFDDSLCLLDRMVQVGLLSKRTTDSNAVEHAAMIELLCKDFSSITGLSDANLLEYPSNLSPSGQYMFCIVCGCLQSVMPSKEGTYYPIIFLDELFDLEHPSIAKKLSNGLDALAKLGGIVVIATHKSHHFLHKAERIITLSAGTVLSDRTLLPSTVD